MERNYKPLWAAAIFSAVLMFVAWRMGAIGPQAVVYVPPFFDQLQLGMSVAEAKALGAIPYDPDAQDGPTGLEFRPNRRDPLWDANHFYTADPVVAETRFRDGRLVHFALLEKGAVGAEVGHSEVMALIPVLIEAKTLRRPYAAKELLDALGPGLRIGRILEEGQEPIDVLRWSVLSNDQAVAHFDAHLSDGMVIEHQLSK